MTANIETFWQTEHKDIILPSLQSLIDDASNDPKRALFELLNSTQNVRLFLVTCFALPYNTDVETQGTTQMVRSKMDDLDAWDRVAWELTKEGNKMFPRGVHVAPAPKPDSMPTLGSRRGSWWDE